MPDLDEEVAFPSGTSAGWDGSDRPDGSHVEDGATRYCGVSGAVPTEDGDDALDTTKIHTKAVTYHTARNTGQYDVAEISMNYQDIILMLYPQQIQLRFGEMIIEMFCCF